MADRPIVIVGAGQAGGWAASTLRSEGYGGPIVLLGDEPHPPHERPPLSKTVLAGEAAPDSTRLFKQDDFAKLGLDFRSATRVERIDRAAKSVLLAGGEAVPYRRLMLCAGSRVRRLAVPGADSPRVHYLRTIDDSVALRRALARARHALVVGAGWIGLEVAATARKAGVDVTVIEALDRVCARGAPDAVSEHLFTLHEKHGVALRLSQGVRAIHDRGGRVSVELGDGSSVEGDLVVAGIGVVPNVELAQSPAAKMSGSDVRPSASTTIPLSTARPADRASSTLGTTPMPATTRSPSTMPPSASSTDNPFRRS